MSATIIQTSSISSFIFLFLKFSHSNFFSSSYERAYIFDDKKVLTDN